MARIDRYELLEELGSGAFGRVYRARHQVLERIVALKVLVAKEERERFLREAAVLARLVHPNIVQIYDSGTTDEGHAFLALELLEGETLAERLRTTGPQPVSEAIWIVDGVLAALESAHAQGVIHRDLKHPNVFLAQDGEEVVVKVLDFGIAKVAGAQRKLTLKGALVGTPRYMAPEVVKGADADARADLWAAGLILYELLVAEPAYPGSPEQALAAIFSGPPAPLRSRAPHLPPVLLDVVDTALEYEPEQRFANASAFREALRQATASRPVRRTTRTEFATGSLDAYDDAMLAALPKAHPEFDDGTTTDVDQSPHWSQNPPPVAPPVAPRRRFPAAKAVGVSTVAALLGGLLVTLGFAHLQEDPPPPVREPAMVAAPSAPREEAAAAPPALRGCEPSTDAALDDLHVLALERALEGAADACAPGPYHLVIDFDPEGYTHISADGDRPVPECLRADVHGRSLDDLAAGAEGSVRCTFD